MGGGNANVPLTGRRYQGAVSTPDLPAAGPVSVDFPTLLGLREGADPTEWGRIRACQLQAGREFALFLFGANLLAIAVTAGLFAETLPLWMVAGWGAITAMAALFMTTRRLRTHHADGSYASLSELRGTALEGALLAVTWSIPPLLFADSGSATSYLLWMILSVLMTAVAVSMAPLALSTLVFLIGVAGAVAAKLALAGAYPAAGASLLFAAMLALGCVTRARSLVLIRTSQIALAERDETVSLLLREFEDQGADWLWETDAARRVVKASPRFAFACGLDPVAINGMPFLQVLAGPSWESGNFAAGLRDLAQKLKLRESFRDLRLPVQVNGEERWWEIAASPRFDERGAFCGFRGVGSDVTEQRASADKINRMARYDTLTGLPNRLMVNETLARAMMDAEKWTGRCAFMMIDLDRFKAVNDTLGHPIGDRLLSRVSERLAQLMGKNELCGRLGGDEFAVVACDASDPS